MDSANFNPQDYFDTPLNNKEIETISGLNTEILALKKNSELNDVNNLLLINRIVAKLYGTTPENTFSEYIPTIADQVNNFGYNIDKDDLLQIFSHIQGICNYLYLYAYSEISYLSYNDLIDQDGVDDKLKTIIDNSIWKYLLFKNDDTESEAVRIYLSVRAAIKHFRGDIYEEQSKFDNYLEEDESHPDTKTPHTITRDYKEIEYNNSPTPVATTMDTLQYIVITQGVEYLEGALLTLDIYEQAAILYQLGIFTLYGDPKKLLSQWGLPRDKRFKLLYKGAKKLYENRYKVKKRLDESEVANPLSLFQIAENLLNFKPLRANNGVLGEQGLRSTIVNMPYELIKRKFTNKQKEVILLAQQTDNEKIVHTINQIASLTNLLPSTVKSIIETVVTIYKEDSEVYVNDNDTVIDNNTTQYKLINLSKQGLTPTRYSVLTSEEKILFNAFTIPDSDERYLSRFNDMNEENKRKKLRSIYTKLTDEKYQKAIEDLESLLETCQSLTSAFNSNELELLEVLRNKLSSGQPMGGITSIWGLGRLSKELGYSEDYLSGFLNKAKKIAINI